ncbi:hypothetical protein HYPDE_37468 [Hyphomicrobium denitrificans 1NES1]|uniref:Uncharacterized protein n=1 Tax=Hyphomicrobium denitrificans 1NES1 TaxID=670307 RepID=N0BGA8_9HYPH|nr:hypothetical protein [Hyphomicrobium denitrificans]AGK59165.1 hypothetical protein HYPDE_37468 [Hyphomicrobium denitrificans 1NES1]
MTLAIVFKGPEGLVLAADSRVTLNTQLVVGGVTSVMPAYFDNATKLLRVDSQTHVAAVTYGLGTIGTDNPRTAHSFIPEFEAEIANDGRLSVKDFAQKLSDFFAAQFKAAKMPVTDDMRFLIGGIDQGAPYGTIYEFAIPSSPSPVETNVGIYGLRWGGQTEITSRILNAIAPEIMHTIGSKLNLDAKQMEELNKAITEQHALPIPYQFLPLQDCVDLAILLVETTAQLMRYTIGIRGVGGDVDVATITRIEGYRPVQVKKLKGKINGTVT